MSTTQQIARQAAAARRHLNHLRGILTHAGDRRALPDHWRAILDRIDQQAREAIDRLDVALGIAHEPDDEQPFKLIFGSPDEEP